MKVHEYKDNNKWVYRYDGKEFKTTLRHSMKSLKSKLNVDSLSVTIDKGTGILYGAMKFNKRTNKPNYIL